MSDSGAQAFISYARRDAKHLQRLQIHLRPYRRSDIVHTFWDDTRIAPGSDWQAAIQEVLASARVAILLISADYLASPFVEEIELPPLLTAAKAKEMLVLPIVLSPCALNMTGLAQFQTVNPPALPVSKMTYHQREELWAQVASMAHTALVSLTAKNAFSENQVVDRQPHQHFAQIGVNLWQKYVVVQLVARTRHSQVMKGWDPLLQRHVAIKLLYPYQELDGQTIERLQQALVREARILGSLDHPNIGSVLEVQLDPLAVIMPWIEGKSLREYVREETGLSVPGVVSLGIRLIGALRYLHERGITHGDIKPANILVQEGEPVLIGFEVASSAQEGTLALNEYGTWNYVGTPEYTAPEQFEHPEIVGPPADVFALGIVLYEVLTGCFPFPYGSDPSLYTVGKLPPPEQMTLPESLYRLLCKMLSQDATLRPTAAGLQDEWQMCLHELNNQ
jgi:predicted Ser/Thr protein kinase